VLLKFIENVGDKTISSILAIYELFRLSFLCFIHLFNPYSYNANLRKIFVKQIYFTAIIALPSFMTIAFFFGIIVMGIVIVIATKFNLLLETGTLIVTFAMNEFAPLFTTFYIAFRSAVVINTEIKTNTLQEHKNDIINNLFLPHIISGILGTVFLAALFALIMISSGYIFSLFYLNMNLHVYSHLILNAIEVRDIMILLLKSTAFGFVTMLLLIYSRVQTLQTNVSFPISILNGMVKLFIAIFLIEVLSLAIQLI
jgi:phospholipid/cholesterol/gamma-HCH transport system permease protein